jgi:diguanylate cyclase (GGDEF)-like protein
MKKFLLVEDSTVVTKIIKHMIKTTSILDCDTAQSFAQAKKLINEKGKETYIAAVVDLNLPDAPNGEVVDYTLKLKIPSIILTGSYDESKREAMLAKPIVDYVVKESRFSYEYVLKLIHRLEKNQKIKVLVTDDSKVSRRQICNMLKTHLYQVIEAEEGQQALDIIHSTPDIRLLITDFNMPVMDGFELVKQIRKEVDKNALVIIGLSSQDTGGLSAKFIKNGANDFLSKPFSHEEFHCRIMHNIETMEHVEAIEHIANHDFLTDLPNRRYFQHQSDINLKQAQKNGIPACLAMLDIDHFKKINDNFGHEAGDAVLRSFSPLLRKVFERFIFARTGGEEFCVLLVGLDKSKAVRLLDNFREMIEDHIIMLDGASITLTFSAGVATDNGNSLDVLLGEADKLLYNAKVGGRNQVVCEP